MFYVVQRARITEDGGLGLLVDFWRNQADHDAGALYVRRNSFRFPNMRRTTVGVVGPNANGEYQTRAGAWVNPDLRPNDPEPRWATETKTLNLRAWVDRTIRSYWRRAEAKGWPRDHAEALVERPDDPNDLLAAPDLADLEGSSGEAD